MKKKSLFRKATALICCIAMCITTFMPAIYAAASGSPTVTVKLPENITVYDDDGAVLQVGNQITAYDYVYSYSDNSVKFEARDEDSLNGQTIFFYVSADIAPTIANTRSITANVSENTDAWASDANWKVSLVIDRRASGDNLLELTEGVRKYNVTFTSDSSLSFVDLDDKAMSNGEYEAGNISFKVNPRPGVNTTGKQITVFANSNPISAGENEIYTYSVNGDVEFYAVMKDITHKVTEPTIKTGAGYTYVSTSSTTVAHGGSFTFYVNPDNGREAPTVDIDNENNATLTNVGNNQYVITNIIGDVGINVKAGDPVQHSVVYPTGVGYEITNNSNTVTDNTDLTFTVAPSDDSYEIKSVTATVGGKVAEVKDNKNGTYTILNVKGDVVISVNAQKKMLDVTVDITDMRDKATTTAANGKVEYGTQYSFYVTPAEGHGNATVYLVNGETETLVNPVTVNGTQYVVTVTENTTIKIVGAELNSYDITLNNGTGFVYQSAAQSVQHNGTYTFDVKVDEAYNKSEPVVSVNNVVIAATNNGENGVWKYEIKNVTENKVVSVSGLQRNTYKVTLQGGAGYNFSTTDSTTVEYNGSFTFRVDIMSGYKVNNLVVKYGETFVEPDTNGNYKIDEITDDITVTVSGVELATSKITNINSTHAKVDITSGNADKIAYNGSISFTVTHDDYYRIENVFVNGESKNALNGTYTVNNITSDVTIDVVTVANKLTVNYVSTEKNHTVDKTATYTIENISTVLSEKLDDCIVHSFNGWNYNGTEADADTLKALIADNDNTATLTADFSVKAENEIKKDLLMTLDATTKEQSTVGAKYRTTFRTAIDIIAAINADVDPCVRDYVKVTAHGTLLANSASAVFYDKVENLKNREDKTSTGKIIGYTVESNAMFNYYVNCNYTWSDFYAACMMDSTSSQIVLRVTSNSQENSLNAAGWVELSIGDTNICIISDESGTSITVAQ